MNAGWNRRWRTPLAFRSGWARSIPAQIASEPPSRSDAQGAGRVRARPLPRAGTGRQTRRKDHHRYDRSHRPPSEVLPCPGQRWATSSSGVSQAYGPRTSRRGFEGARLHRIPPLSRRADPPCLLRRRVTVGLRGGSIARAGPGDGPFQPASRGLPVLCLWRSVWIGLLHQHPGSPGFDEASRPTMSPSGR